MEKTDAELLGLAREDPQAFREFYERYAVWLHAWLQRATGAALVAFGVRLAA